VAATIGAMCSSSGGFTPSAIASAWLRMTVSGVRSSWVMSASTDRRRVSSDSSRALIALKARARERTSPGPRIGTLAE
jgi:hypothetical protein